MYLSVKLKYTVQLKRAHVSTYSERDIKNNMCTLWHALADKKSHAEVVSPFILCLLLYHRASTKKRFIHM